MGVAPQQPLFEDGLQQARAPHIPGIVKLAHEALKADPIKGQLIDWEKIQRTAQECVLDSINYAGVSVMDGEVVAAVCALIIDQPVFERKMASVAQFYTKVPGEGEKVIREFLRWARGLRKIKSIVFTLENGADPRIRLLLQRMGLRSEMTTMVEWR